MVESTVCAKTTDKNIPGWISKSSKKKNADNLKQNVTFEVIGCKLQHCFAYIVYYI